MNADTIASIATPAGRGGIATLRLSGSNALPIALRCLAAHTLHPRHATHTSFLTPTGEYLDDGIALYFAAPSSYTGEDTVELTCHGSPYVQEALLNALIEAGARLAEPGEYTLRAFRNGRLDLSQAEAVADLIDATTPQQHRLAISQLRGSYAARLADLRQRLVDLTALLELELDFSQEDVEFASRDELRRLLRELDAEITRLLTSFAAGNALKRGIPVAIAGRPNAGKSSLLNALLADDRAIVSPTAGTTRDTIEEPLTHRGLTFRLIDTAGLRHSTDLIEAQGIERSRRAISQAMLTLYVHDLTQPSSTITADLQALQLSRANCLLVLNKADLSPTSSLPYDLSYGDSFPTAIPLCARSGKGVEALLDAMVQHLQPHLDTSDNPLLTNLRHRDALLRTQTALRSALDGLSTLLPADLIAIDLRDALFHLGTITGHATTDDILSSVFSRFCIGK